MSADDFSKNPAWVQRMEEVYAAVDLNKDGVMSLEDWEMWVDNIEKDVKPEPQLVLALRTRMQEFCAGMGLTSDKKATKEEFISSAAAMAEAERAKKLKGEETLLEQLNNAWYDVVDTNHDGCVTLDEWRQVQKACNCDASAADRKFEAVDKDKNGKIERKELNSSEFKFWFTLDDEDSKKILGE